jgi:acylphosphatase
MKGDAEQGIRWIVSGKVQGVGFRWFTIQRAQALGIAGWVTNLPDGRVEVVGRGTEAQLHALERALRAGPPGANVETVEKSDVPHQAVPVKTFGIR